MAETALRYILICIFTLSFVLGVLKSLADKSDRDTISTVCIIFACVTILAVLIWQR